MSWVTKLLGRSEPPAPISFPSVPIMGNVVPGEADTAHLGDAEVAGEGDVDAPIALGRLYNGKDADATSGSVGSNQTETVAGAHTETVGLPGVHSVPDVTLKRGTFGPGEEGSPQIAGTPGGAEAAGNEEVYFKTDLKEGRGPDGGVDGLAGAADPQAKGGNVEFEWKVEEGESAPPAEIDGLAWAADPQAKGGNIEFEWKVEEGESAPPAEIDDLASAADAEPRGVFVKSWSTSGDADARDNDPAVGGLAGDDAQSAARTGQLNVFTFSKKSESPRSAEDDDDGPNPGAGGAFAAEDGEMAEGRRQYAPITFTKRIDKSSPAEEEEPATLADLEADEPSDVAGKFSAILDEGNLPTIDDVDLADETDV